MWKYLEIIKYITSGSSTPSIIDMTMRLVSSWPVHVLLFVINVPFAFDQLATVLIDQAIFIRIGFLQSMFNQFTTYCHHLYGIKIIFLYVRLLLFCYYISCNVMEEHRGRIIHRGQRSGSRGRVMLMLCSTWRRDCVRIIMKSHFICLTLNNTDQLHIKMHT